MEQRGEILAVWERELQGRKLLVGKRGKARRGGRSSWATAVAVAAAAAGVAGGGRWHRRLEGGRKQRRHLRQTRRRRRRRRRPGCHCSRADSCYRGQSNLLLLDEQLLASVRKEEGESRGWRMSLWGHAHAEGTDLGRVYAARAGTGTGGLWGRIVGGGGS